MILVSMYMIMASSSATQAVAEEGVLTNKRIAVVIDDLGNDMLGTREMIELPVPITVAVMPFLPTTRRDAEWAHQLGHEVLIHMPMEPVRGKKSWLGPGAITTDLSDEEIRQRVLAAIEEVPFAIGMNNHMGSKVTADARIMRIVLQVCKEKNLIYLDSKTTSKSVVKPIAVELGVRIVENNIFMDDVYTREHISKQAVKVKKHVKDNDTTIVIGHVGPPGKNTAAVLKQSVPTIQELAQFVTISKLAP
ncbi:divergent polysaccharide deacetylase family protein [Paenibacillus sp. LMG 31456]|uniref:Divergent polysaccharide deacetylase family protein n=2 Tax=Paenibacillus foliorum TaxID=2654974 RepID=A0A972GTP3_9BACL|nr:divergent polysaccharide deacetylase family protein [Paenibacillus foliorum]